jgi:siroheme synthase (precorrin-2 oxidase/ferrochelatase)
MSDKDLLVVISEMLRKQTSLIIETNSTLKEFMNVSIQQFQERLRFNEKFLNKLDEISKKP